MIRQLLCINYLCSISQLLKVNYMIISISISITLW